ncbi:Piso0_001510 [Millerozyma farinosa CBS 7064]|uniref:Piso0_001510 protein n=1 Tax=Pichia sorbitophila (strain ATCC MYA-4447 / BCRC 22081 / CBS 7064 / NBRC 10061 / NRRL Y-12695) TaxID=559304 RepID=G8YNC8_PICSO|nr:Piso0_001510 [Millerozyma farinosa CBS 7064]
MMKHTGSVRGGSSWGSMSFGDADSFKDKIPSESVNYITFNQDSSCVAIALNNGYKIFNCSPSFSKCCQVYRNESIGKIEMLYCTSLIAIVGLGEEAGSSPRKLKIVNTKRQATICDLVFPSSILRVKLTRSRLIVLLEEQIYIYDITTMKLLHTIETTSNTRGLCAVSPGDSEGNNKYMAYPSPPKTIAHDSLLVNGVNTNGGQKSVQNNVQSVSNSPNRIGDVIVFDTESLQPLCVIEAHKAALAAFALSNDGTLLATASDKGTIIRVFSVSTGVKLYQFRRGTYPTRIFSISFSLDNKYVVATSSSGTVHIFRLGDEEALETKQQRKRNSKRYSGLGEAIKEESAEDVPANPDFDDDEEIHDDGDNSDTDESNYISTSRRNSASCAVSDTNSLNSSNNNDNANNEESRTGQDRVLSTSSNNSDTFRQDGNELQNQKGMSEPLVDQNRISVARLIRKSSQNLGRKAARKMGDFLPSRFSSILEPTRHFASLKINSASNDIKSIAMINTELSKSTVPPSYFSSKDQVSSPNSDSSSRNLLTVNLLHINVVTSEGYFYTYGLDPERGGDCILLQQFYLLD